MEEHESLDQWWLKFSQGPMPARLLNCVIAVMNTANTKLFSTSYCSISPWLPYCSRTKEWPMETMPRFKREPI